MSPGPSESSKITRNHSLLTLKIRSFWQNWGKRSKPLVPVNTPMTPSRWLQKPLFLTSEGSHSGVGIVRKHSKCYKSSFRHFVKITERRFRVRESRSEPTLQNDQNDPQKPPLSETGGFEWHLREDDCERLSILKMTKNHHHFWVTFLWT